MKNFVVVILCIISLASCSKKRGGGGSDVGTTNDNYVSVTQMQVCVGNDATCNELNAFYRVLDMFNPIAAAYAALAPTASITYTASISGTMTLAALPAVSEVDPSQPSFGTLNVNAFDSNDLKKCGVGGNQKCTEAIIRAYVSSRSSGFVSDGAIIRIDGIEVLDGVNNSITLASGTIANNVNRIRKNPAHQNPFAGSESDLGELTLDLNNAHHGTYSAVIVIELAIGPVI